MLRTPFRRENWPQAVDENLPRAENRPVVSPLQEGNGAGRRVKGSEGWVQRDVRRNRMMADKTSEAAREPAIVAREPAIRTDIRVSKGQRGGSWYF